MIRTDCTTRGIACSEHGRFLEGPFGGMGVFVSRGDAVRTDTASPLYILLQFPLENAIFPPQIPYTVAALPIIFM